ncbi:MAG: hydrogenase [Deltaproteobacteria bacterium]|nr:hydrogenase [Deltaproteobacteria bacterium]
MIVRRNLKLAIIFRMAWKSLVFFSVMAVIAPTIHRELGIRVLDLDPATVGPLGTALAIFLAFRNSTAYDRWWEARKLWGSLINQSRNFARQVMTYIAPGDPAHAALRRSLILQQIAYAHALRAALRKAPHSLHEPLAQLIDDPELRARIVGARSTTTTVLEIQGEILMRAYKAQLVDGIHHVELERTLSAICDVQGGCERIKNTPLIRPYDYYPRIFVYVYTLFLPFALVGKLGWVTAIVSLPVSFLFYVLSRIGITVEDPFEGRFSDVPLDALCRTIEISLREQAGDLDLPQPLEPIDGFLM